jgi:hypothetical protein
MTDMEIFARGSINRESPRLKDELHPGLKIAYRSRQGYLGRPCPRTGEDTCATGVFIVLREPQAHERQLGKV